MFTLISTLCTASIFLIAAALIARFSFEERSARFVSATCLLLVVWFVIRGYGAEPIPIGNDIKVLFAANGAMIAATVLVSLGIVAKWGKRGIAAQCAAFMVTASGLCLTQLQLNFIVL